MRNVFIGHFRPKEKVLSLIEQNADLDKISSATGACTGCGSCDVDIMNLIIEHGKAT